MAQPGAGVSGTQCGICVARRARPLSLPDSLRAKRRVAAPNRWSGFALYVCRFRHPPLECWGLRPLPCNLGSGSLVTAWTGTGGRADAGSKGKAVKRSCRFGLLGLLHLAQCREETQAAGGEGPRATPGPAPSPGRFWVARSPAGGDWSSRFSLNPIYEARLLIIPLEEEGTKQQRDWSQSCKRGRDLGATCLQCPCALPP